MADATRESFRRFGWLMFTVTFLALTYTSALAEGYGNALKGVRTFDAVYEVSQGDPKVANVIFWAIRDSYETPEVRAFSKAPNIAIVFHGPAVKLISSDKTFFTGSDAEEVGKFHETLRQMKKDGVTMEVCLYAAKVLGVDKATIIPEIDQVANGFVSVIGYQMQGYAVVRVP